MAHPTTGDGLADFAIHMLPFTIGTVLAVLGEWKLDNIYKSLSGALWIAASVHIADDLDSMEAAGIVAMAGAYQLAHLLFAKGKIRAGADSSLAGIVLGLAIGIALLVAVIVPAVSDFQALPGVQAGFAGFLGVIILVYIGALLYMLIAPVMEGKGEKTD